MINPFKLLKKEKYVEPCDKAKYIMGLNGNNRTMSLSDIPNEPGKCTWCEGELKGRQTRWCSEECVRTAMDMCGPQNPGPKMKILIFKQNCACPMCGVSFEDQIKEKIIKLFKRKNRHKKVGDNPELVTFYELGYGTGDIWHVDHIHPVSWGGKGIDPNNLQVLCVPCHKLKTRDENIYERERRIK